MQTQMIKIKKTKSVEIKGDNAQVIILMNPELVGDTWVLNGIEIPIKYVFQVKRGLESYVQKFYRKHK